VYVNSSFHIKWIISVRPLQKSEEVLSIAGTRLCVSIASPPIGMQERVTGDKKYLTEMKCLSVKEMLNVEPMERLQH
jgi:hypothetical protein